MPERKQMVSITIVTDDDTGMYHIGEPGGLFQQGELLEYLQQRGQKGKLGILEHLAYLQNQVIESWRKVNSGDNVQCNAKHNE